MYSELWELTRILLTPPLGEAISVYCICILNVYCRVIRIIFKASVIQHYGMSTVSHYLSFVTS